MIASTRPSACSSPVKTSEGACGCAASHEGWCPTSREDVGVREGVGSVGSKESVVREEV